jgi:hypothetical protein
MTGMVPVSLLPAVDLVLITCSILLTATDISGNATPSGETGVIDAGKYPESGMRMSTE